MLELFDTFTRGHHPHSPSSLQSSEACAHFKNRQTDSEAARAGTDPAQIAAVNRALLVEKKWIDALTVTLKQEENGITVANDFTPDIVREKYLPVDATHIEFGDVGYGGPTKWIGITGGYPDTVLVQERTRQAVVLDWKFGRQFVTPTVDNMQGRAYAAGVFEAYPKVDTVAVVFYHPHLEVDDDGEAVVKPEYTHEFTRAERDFIELQCRTFVSRKKLAKKEGLNQSTIPQIPKTELCLWCDNVAECKPLGALMVLGASKHKEISVPDVFFGVTEEEFEACINVPITKIDAAIKAKAPKGKGAPTVREFREQAQEAGALVMGDGYLYLQEVKSEKANAVEQRDLDI
ncbi:MAG: hypothetical protein EBR82_32125 [Caulobacteraceae bacterium]|nr:hypothetical protein [Caulobacteraceae bacterium]